MRTLILLISGLISLLISSSVISAEFYDPMRPPAYALNKFWLEKNKKNKKIKTGVQKAARAMPFVLSSILFSNQRKHAIINNKLVKKGDIIKGARVVLLRPDSVRLVKKGKVINLSLRSKNQVIKKSLSENAL